MLQYTLNEDDSDGAYTSETTTLFYKYLQDNRKKVIIAIPTDPHFTVDPSTVNTVRHNRDRCKNEFETRFPENCLKHVSTIYQRLTVKAGMVGMSRNEQERSGISRNEQEWTEISRNAQERKC